MHPYTADHLAVDDLLTGGPPVAMSQALSDEWDQDQLEEEAMLAKLGHLDESMQ